MTQVVPPPEPQLHYIEPSSDMADLVHTLFVMRTGEGATEDVMPAYSAQLVSFVEGAGSIHFPDGPIGHSSDVTLNAPLLKAAPMLLEGPVINVGASFTPLGWAAFSGLDADKAHDCTFDASTIIAPEPYAQLREALAHCRAGAITPDEYCRAIEGVIRDVCRTPERQPSEDHVKLVRAIDDWLESAFSPPVSHLYASVDLGQRQVQRLCRRYYGVPPAQLVKRYRAIRAAMLLAHEDLSAELRDEVLGAYFDQAHLIHDVRRYTGRTPKSLSREPLAQDMLDPSGHGETAKKLRED
ncbi:MAG: helix-turn-helix domain-containing protein [Pseudomonadota bacterium]